MLASDNAPSMQQACQQQMPPALQEQLQTRMTKAMQEIQAQ